MDTRIIEIRTEPRILHFEQANGASFLSVYKHTKDMYMNIHDEMEIIYVHTGTLRLFADDALYELHGGEAIILNGCCVHFGLASPSPDTWYDAILVDCHRLCLAENDDPETNIYRKLIDRELFFETCILRDENALALLAEIRRILSVAAGNSPFWKMQIIAAYYSIAAVSLETGLLREAPTEPAVQKEQWKQDMELYISFKKYVIRHYHKAISMPEIADALHISVSKLYKVCKWILGYPPVEYIYRCRLMMAAQMLKSTGMPVSEISYACGFRNLSYFIRRFRKIYGLTPSRFRLCYTEK